MCLLASLFAWWTRRSQPSQRAASSAEQKTLASSLLHTSHQIFIVDQINFSDSLDSIDPQDFIIIIITLFLIRTNRSVWYKKGGKWELKKVKKKKDTDKRVMGLYGRTQWDKQLSFRGLLTLIRLWRNLWIQDRYTIFPLVLYRQFLSLSK